MIILVEFSACANEGPCSPSHAWRGTLSPHRPERKFSGTHVCRVTFKHLSQPLWSHITSFGTLGQLFKIPSLSAQICHSRGVPKFLMGLESSYVCYLGAHSKFQNPTTITPGRISNEPEETTSPQSSHPASHSTLHSAQMSTKPNVNPPGL
jgi:hypothetical protein